MGLDDTNFHYPGAADYVADKADKKVTMVEFREKREDAQKSLNTLLELK